MAALRDQLDTFWQRALAGYTDIVTESLTNRPRRSHDPDRRPGWSAKQIVVEAPIDRAFAVFTERFGDFKPPEHNLLGAPIAETVFEPRVGGNIIDRGQSTAASAAGHGSWRTSRRTGWCSAGTSARNGRSRPTRT